MGCATAAATAAAAAASATAAAAATEVEAQMDPKISCCSFCSSKWNLIWGSERNRSFLPIWLFNSLAENLQHESMTLAKAKLSKAFGDGAEIG